MPPARPRAFVDDSRSETSSVIASLKERVKSGAGVAKNKKRPIGSTNDSNSIYQAAVNGAQAAANAVSHEDAEMDSGIPQTDWNSIPVSTLHTYRAAYQIQLQSSFTQPHAELIYNSAEIALRAPSVVRARRQERELHLHRKKRAQLNASGVSKSKRGSKDKPTDDSSDASRRKRKGINGTHDDSIAQSIEPRSPALQSQSASSDSAPSLLDNKNPELTLIGRSSPAALALTVRKHFNAQQLNEAETIAKFTYVARQQGYGYGPTPTSNGVATSTSSKSSAPIRVEGSDGDGTGWIMGSMGRQVRVNDSGGGGAFRLRFRP